MQLRTPVVTVAAVVHCVAVDALPHDGVAVVSVVHWVDAVVAVATLNFFDEKCSSQTFVI